MEITPIVPLLPTDQQPLSHARIGYENLLTASTTAEAEKMLIPNTFERYRPTAGAKTVKFQLSSSAEIDFIGIAAHNSGSHDGGVDITVAFATTIGGALTDIENIQFPDNQAKMILFDAVTVAEIAITFNATTLGLELGIIYAGKALQMTRALYGGHSPIDLSAETEYQSVMSDTGQFLGRTITSQGTESTFNWRFLDPAWYRDTFQTFVNSAKTKPFFLSWRPDLFSSTVFGHTVQDIRPSNSGGGSKLMEVSINIRAHADTI